MWGGGGCTFIELVNQDSVFTERNLTKVVWFVCQRFESSCYQIDNDSVDNNHFNTSILSITVSNNDINIDVWIESANNMIEQGAQSIDNAFNSGT